jgi:hypothetical protein
MSMQEEKWFFNDNNIIILEVTWRLYLFLNDTSIVFLEEYDRWAPKKFTVLYSWNIWFRLFFLNDIQYCVLRTFGLGGFS